MNINLMTRNDFDETLEGRAVLSGEGVVSLLNNPALRTSFTFSAGDLMTTAKFRSANGILRVDPGETIWLRIFWDCVDENGVTEGF